MSWIVNNLYLIPLIPLLAAGFTCFVGKEKKRLAAGIVIGAMGASFVLSLVAFLETLGWRADLGEVQRQFSNFDWMSIGGGSVRLGWLLDPLSAAMLVMVTFVGLLIFIFSVGYMQHDKNFTSFFCFLALFAAAMLGLVIANSLLLLFICWELVGLASYLLIGFWFHKPSAAAAATKAFITTRIGDVFFLLGMVWLYAETGTLVFFDDGGAGCLETAGLAKLASQAIVSGMELSTAISVLIFLGAVGKSGQFPLHVWLPDAMEGPTPVSALIHAATMVAAGVFLVARLLPIMALTPDGLGVSATMQIVTWVGAITALFAACIAVAQNDIKRILAYSTVSQLGYMFMGLGTGGVAVGMFHLLTHACFKALLFLGAGSVIHGCHHEQDIRKMGGLSKLMPLTFATYAVGMMALSGVPVLFSGFWSKDEILHAAGHWDGSHIPFVMGLVGAVLTAFYMTRQMCYVFFGKNVASEAPHESPSVMTIPLAVLAALAVLVGFFGTPAWPWLQTYLDGGAAHVDFDHLFEGGVLGLMALSVVLSGLGIGLGWWLYGKRPAGKDPLEVLQPAVFRALQKRLFIDERVARLQGLECRGHPGDAADALALVDQSLLRRSTDQRRFR